MEPVIKKPGEHHRIYFRTNFWGTTRFMCTSRQGPNYRHSQSFTAFKQWLFLINFIGLKGSIVALNRFRVGNYFGDFNRIRVFVGVLFSSSVGDGLMLSAIRGTDMEEELRDMKAHKAYISQVDFVANAKGHSQLCPRGSIMKRTVDEVDTYDYLPEKVLHLQRLENGGLHFRQPWVMAVEEEVERLKQRVHDHDKLLRECEALKSQVRRLRAGG
ncbi:hypothetical protein Bca52824_071349 [Brassica carinata]|uniref:Uncharacterized protein n=1 Tax=Brassica carinata TaxID=52824 RepID=A0A8X7U2Y6_BRACI|nr:hypothetical protein Bca52824_071349 [Brassica carinata]